jgi:hypothetical protein
MDREAAKIQRRSARHGRSAAVKVNAQASLTARNDPAFGCRIVSQNV